MNRVLDLDALRAFVLVVETGRFSMAANALSRTQSTISMQIRRLEEQLACTLLYRKQTGAVPTAEGSELMTAASEMLALNDQVFDAVKQTTVAGRVRIGAIEHYAVAVLPALVARFCRIYPEVLVEIHTGAAGVMRTQLRTEYDLVVGISEAGSAPGTLLSRSRVVWAVSRQVDVHRQSPLPLALGVEGGLLRAWGTRALDNAGIPWRMAYCSSSVAALEASVKAGLAVGIFNEHTINKRLRVLGAKDGLPPLPRVDVWLLQADMQRTRAVTLLHDFLISAIPRSK
ncbi:LysR substrate-binding domain-containing protein [Paraburkholderia sp. SIMBA_053]|uniref:LysR substrate-binding domain-containing protein n=1 Tax=Paraburkholderia sp. SIMBA_053 TaxID=3085794 RepID=UPI00397B93C3